MAPWRGSTLRVSTTHPPLLKIRTGWASPGTVLVPTKGLWVWPNTNLSCSGSWPSLLGASLASCLSIGPPRYAISPGSALALKGAVGVLRSEAATLEATSFRTLSRTSRINQWNHPMTPLRGTFLLIPEARLPASVSMAGSDCNMS